MSVGPIYLRNDVLSRNDGTMHRVLAIHAHGSGKRQDDHAWMIALGEELALPYSITVEKLDKEFQHYQASVVGVRRKNDANQPAEPLIRKPSAASLALSDAAMARIAPLVDDPRIFVPSSRHALLQERSQQLGGGTPKTLLKDLRNWWQGGQTQDALLGKFHLCGRLEVIGTGGRGRHRARAASEEQDSPNPGKAGYQLTQRDLDCMRGVLEKVYFDVVKHPPLTDVLDILHRTHYTYVDGNGKECIRPTFECPSYRQLDYFLRRNYPLAQRLTLRKGKKRFAQEDRSTEGSIQVECHGAGHIYEFDATIVDVHLVSSADSNDIVGKPTLYLIIDRYSRLIVGFYLGFENPNYTAAMQAILSIGEDKEELCRQLGLDYDPADWPAHGVLPEMFLADQGELTSKKARRIARSLRCMLSNVPGLRPDWKPLVECGFRMLHRIIEPTAPAYSPDAEARQRRRINRDNEASLNLLAFTKLIVAAIIAHNKTMQRNYPLSVAQVADRVRPIPRELFSHSVKRRMGVLDRMDFERVREELLPRGSATITEDGIRFEKMFYSCPEAQEKGWLVQGRKARAAVNVAYDPRLVDEIVIYPPDDKGEPCVATLTKDSVIFRSMSLKEVHRHWDEVGELTADAEEIRRLARFEYYNATQSTIDESNAKMRTNAKGHSRSSRKKDTAPARAVELQLEQQQNAGVRPRVAAQAPTPVVSSIVQLPMTAKVVPIKRPLHAMQDGDVVQAPRNEATPVQPNLPSAPMTLKERMLAKRQTL